MTDAGQNAANITLRRLKHRKDFLKVANRGSKVVASTLVLQGLCPEDSASSDQSAIEVGFTVTKKVGNAVVRNRIRRRLKAAADEQLPVQGIAGCSYVVIGRKTALDAPFSIILRDLGYGLRKLKKKFSAGEIS